MWNQFLSYFANLDWGLIIGVVALIFTAISLRMQQKHNRLSVTPIAIISVGDYLDELAVYLQNKGTGPLIIQQLSFLGENGRREKSIIDFFGEDFRRIIWSTFVEDIDGWAILPGETKTLVKLEGNPSNKNFKLNRQKVRKVLSEIQVELVYHDIYGNVMPKKIRKLDYFAR